MGPYEFTETATNLEFPEAQDTDTAIYEVTAPPPPCPIERPRVTIIPDTQTGAAGSQLEYQIKLENLNPKWCPDYTYEVVPTLPGPGWTQFPAKKTITQRSQSSSTTNTYITSAKDAAPGQHQFTETATNVDFPDDTGSDAAIYEVPGTPPPPPPCNLANPTITISPTSQAGEPGTTLVYSLELLNNNSAECAADTFDVLPTLPGPSWSQVPASLSETLTSGARVTRSVSITSAKDAAPGLQNFTETMTNVDAPSYQDTDTATYEVLSPPPPPPPPCILANPTITIVPSSQAGEAGAALTYQLTLVNNNSAECVADIFDVLPTLPGPGWTQSPASLIETLVSGETATRQVSITSPTDAAIGLHTFTETITNSDEPTYQDAETATYEVLSPPPPPCLLANPTITISPLSQEGPPGGALTYTLQLVNNNSAECAADTFDVLPTLPGTGWTQAPTSLTEILASGAMVTRTVNLTSPADAAPGPHVFTETMTNADAPAYADAEMATYVVQDATPPTVKITEPPDGAVLDWAGLHLIRAAASDNVGVTKVEFYINGSLRSTDTVAPYEYLWNPKYWGDVGTMPIEAKAYDDAGNLASDRITVTVKKSKSGGGGKGGGKP